MQKHWHLLISTLLSEFGTVDELRGSSSIKSRTTLASFQAITPTCRCFVKTETATIAGTTATCQSLETHKSCRIAHLEQQEPKEKMCICFFDMIKGERTHLVTLLRAVMLATMTLSGLGVATALKVPFQNFSKSSFSSSCWRPVVLPCDPRAGGGPQGPSWSEHGGCISWRSLS